MAQAEAPGFHNPFERVAHVFQEIPHWMGRHWVSLSLTVAALGTAGYVSWQLARPYTPDTQAKTTVPVSDPFKPAGPGSEVVIPTISTETPVPPTVTATTAPKPPELPPTQEPAKGIINNKTANLIDLPPAEVQQIIDQAKAKGETVIALPDWVRQEGVEIREFTNTKGKQQFAIVAPNGEYELPALTGGKISVLSTGPNSNLNIVAVSIGAGEDWFVYLPASATSTHQAGQEVTAGQPLVTFDHDPDSQAGRNFQNFLKTQVVTNPNSPLPENTLAIIGRAQTGTTASALNLTFQQLAKDSQNNFVVTGSK